MKFVLLLSLTLGSLAWQGCAGMSSVPSDGKLSDRDRIALAKALADEREGVALYRAVIAKHGEVRPFSQLVQAELRHEQELLALFAKYELDAPAATREEIVVPESFATTCREAAESEIWNGALYDQLIEEVERSDIREVFERLQAASIERHLPALNRCAHKRGSSQVRRSSTASR